VLKGKEKPCLLKPAKKPAKVSKAAKDSWEGVDKQLFEILRRLRQEIAQNKHVPAYIVFGDATLRDMARRRPSTPETLLEVNGVGEKKCQQYGETILDAIKEYCFANGVDMDVRVFCETSFDQEPMAESEKGSNFNKARRDAFELFRQGVSIKEVAQSIDRAESTTVQYLVEYIKQEEIDNPYPWVDDEQIIRRVAEAGVEAGFERLKPIFDYLNGEVSYNQIRIIFTCLGNC